MKQPIMLLTVLGIILIAVLLSAILLMPLDQYLKSTAYNESIPPIELDVTTP
jgi:hypothetical protein